MTYLGMQIMVEGLALAAFGFMHQMTTEPLLKQLLRYVMSDEARHVAFGVLSLQGGLRGHDRRRDHGAPGVRLRGRRAHARPLPVAGGVGAHGRRRRRRSIPLRPERPDTARLFQQMLFSKIVPNCKKLGLLDARRRLAAPTASRRSASSSSRTGPTPARSTAQFALGQDAAGRRERPQQRRRCAQRTSHRTEQGHAGTVGRGWRISPTRACSSLHALHVKGFATVEDSPSSPASPSRGRVAADPDARSRSLALFQRGPRRSGSSPPRAEQARRDLIAAELKDAGVDDGMRERLPRVPRAQRAVQGAVRRLAAVPEGRRAPNDHSDAAYDKAVIERLVELDRNAQAACASPSPTSSRAYAPYAPRLTTALEKVKAGDQKLFTGVMCGSYHDVWMELHEDLILTLGIDRAKKGASDGGRFGRSSPRW